MSLNVDSTKTVLDQNILLSVAEQLKLPLVQISNISQQASASPLDFERIQISAQNALRLIDSYCLGLRLASNPQSLYLEPVSVSSVLYDVGQDLDDFAKSYRVDLELNISGKFNPVSAHKAGLQAALVSLGSALIEAIPAQEGARLSLQLATHRCKYGIVAGLYADIPDITNEALKRGRALLGRSRQTLTDISHSSAAGIFVADSILRSMDLELKASRHHHLYGIGTIMQQNKQLQLV